MNLGRQLCVWFYLYLNCLFSPRGSPHTIVIVCSFNCISVPPLSFLKFLHSYIYYIYILYICILNNWWWFFYYSKKWSFIHFYIFYYMTCFAYIHSLCLDHESFACLCVCCYCCLLSFMILLKQMELTIHKYTQIHTQTLTHAR